MKSQSLCFLVLASFCLVPLLGQGADVSYYGVVKSAQYEQTLTSAPALNATNPYAFTAFVVASTNGVVTNASVKPSNSTPACVLQPQTNDTAWLYVQQFADQGSMDAVFPTGTFLSPVNYTFTIGTTNDGVHTGSLAFSLLGPLTYPSTPQMNNLSAAQSIDTTRDFQVTWNPLGGSTLTIVQFMVMDSASNLVYATPFPFQTGALDGTSTSTVIPAYALPPGTNLTGHLTVGNPGLPNTSSYPGATGVAALVKDTSFPLATRPAPVPPILQILPLPPQASQFELRLIGEPNRFYQIQATDNLSTWTNLFTTNSVSGVFDFVDTNSPNFNLRLYRGKVGQ